MATPSTDRPDPGPTPTSRRALRVGLTAVVAAAGVAVGVLATRSHPPAPRATSPVTTTRAVALGDSVPYGHGLANPYQAPQVGLAARDVSQGPSTKAYPSLVAGALGLTMRVRPTNCHLTGDQLAISGAVADGADNTSPNGQCPAPPVQARNLDDEVAAADLVHHPARLVLIQAGADDIDFAACLEYELARVAGLDAGFGTSCVDNATVTPKVAAELANVRSSLAAAIESVAPHAKTVAVLDYYQPIPQPSQIDGHVLHSSAGTNLICTALRANASASYSAAQVVLRALNQAIAGAVGDARADHVHNVRLVDVSSTMNGHGICTADPWIFSGESIPGTTVTTDLSRIVAAKACSATGALHTRSACDSLAAAASAAVTNIRGYVWRVAHPNGEGQTALAATTERALGGAT